MSNHGPRAPRTPQRPPSQSRYGGYKPPSPEDIRARAESRGSSRYDGIFKGGVIAWRPKEGSNLIRFLPPTWAPEPGKEDKGLHYAYTAYVHEWVGPEQGSYMCLRMHQGKPCPICRDAALHRQRGDEDEARKLSWRERRLCYLLDRDGDDPTRPQLFNMSKTQDTDIAAITWDRRAGDALYIEDPDFGYDLSFDRVGAGLKSRYSAYRVARQSTPIHEDQRIQDQILDYITDNPVPDMLQFYASDYMERALMIGGGEASAPDTRGHDLLNASRRDPYEEGVTIRGGAPESYAERGKQMRQAYDEPAQEDQEDPWEGELPEEEVDTTPQPEPRHAFRRPAEEPAPRSLPRQEMRRDTPNRRPLK